MISQRWNQWLDRLGLRVASLDALLYLTMLAIPVGLLAGGVVIGFRLLIETVQGYLLPNGATENYEALSGTTRLLLASGGGLLIGLLWQYLGEPVRQVGIVHVMQRLAYHQGRLPWQNALAQFIGGAASIICGHSVGREGPSVHLGATCGSQLGQWLHLPNNSNRTLAACGIAAAIAASFNTPLAGVIFSMEVVMMEYSLVSFAPVILAAVTATTLSRVVFGEDPVFSIPETHLGSLLELPYVILMGCMLGCLAALFIHLLQHTTRGTAHLPVWLRCTLGGVSVGLLAGIAPQVMGIGYDTVNQALLGELGLLLLLGVCAAKLLATALGLGLGLPGGLIGPTLVIGSLGGGAMGIIADTWLPGDIASPAFYALIGMGTMMGATLQAPLAALTAMLELTANPYIILPGMLALISGTLISREVFDKESVYLVLMRVRGQEYQGTPVTQALRRIGVASVMDRNFVTLPRQVDRQHIQEALAGEPRWILILDGKSPLALMPAADIAHHVQERGEHDAFDLTTIPARRQEVTAIDFKATLEEACNVLDRSSAEALYVTRSTVPGITRIYGVLTWRDIEHSYRIEGP